MNTTEKQNYAAAFLNTDELNVEEQSNTLIRSNVSVVDAIQIGELSCEKLIGSVTANLKGRAVYYVESSEGEGFTTGGAVNLVFDELFIDLAEDSADVQINNSSVYSTK